MSLIQMDCELKSLTKRSDSRGCVLSFLPKRMKDDKSDIKFEAIKGRKCVEINVNESLEKVKDRFTELVEGKRDEIALSVGAMTDVDISLGLDDEITLYNESGVIYLFSVADVRKILEK